MSVRYCRVCEVLVCPLRDELRKGGDSNFCVSERRVRQDGGELVLTTLMALANFVVGPPTAKRVSVLTRYAFNDSEAGRRP